MLPLMALPVRRPRWTLRYLTLLGRSITERLEKRISHRRAMKNAMGRAMRAGAKGIKCCCSGRLAVFHSLGQKHY